MKLSSVTYEDWMNGDAVSVGRALMEQLPAAQQVARAKAVLDICRAHWSPVQEIDRVATIAADRARWVEGHHAFDDVRGLKLREIRNPTNKTYEALLNVAEIAAKTIYNASAAPAPFDHNSPWKLPRNARDFVRAQGDEKVAREIWRSLTAS